MPAYPYIKKAFITTMQPYTQYSLEDFLQDSQFRQWVITPTAEEDSFWNQWLIEYPHKQAIVEQARLLLLSIDGMQHVAIQEEEVQREIKQILALSEASEEETSRQQPFIAWRSTWVRIAATVVLLLGIQWWWASRQEQTATTTTLSQAETPLDNEPVVIINTSRSPLAVNLSDGSTIILQPNSQVNYPKVFTGNSREVHLTGEAFFEIQKNPAKPFYVHAQTVVTKVLGTSFCIKTDSIHQRVTVSVKTGKVSVYTTSAERTTAIALKGDPDAILTPNQQVVYEEVTAKSFKPVLNLTNVVTLLVPDTHFIFNSTPTAQVFAALEKAYGVHISYEEEALKGCSITATLTDEPLVTKLDLICKSIGLDYQLNNTEVAISGKGCLQ
jgi:transmembrane sensor